MSLCLLEISINNTSMSLFFDTFRVFSCVFMSMCVCVSKRHHFSHFACVSVCPIVWKQAMYHILVTSGQAECIIHFHLGSCNRVCACLCVCLAATGNVFFSWGKCLSVCRRERDESDREGELAHLCNNLGLDVSGHFYKC